MKIPFKNICVTGSTGFVGNHLLPTLLKEGKCNVAAVIKSDESDFINRIEGVTYYADNGITDDLVDFFIGNEFQLVIHLASLYLKDHQGRQVNDLVESNVLFGTRLLEASAKSGVRAFINTGTFWQHYKGAEYSPVNLYAATKQAFEDMAKFYIESEGIYFVTLKLSDTYGPGDPRKKIFNIWQALKSNEPLKMSPGGQMIDIMHIDDIVGAFMALITQISKDLESRRLTGKSFSVHNSRIVTLKELAGVFEKVSGRKLNIEWGALPYREREVMVPWSGGECIDCWEQKISLEDGIQEFIKRTEKNK